MKTKYWSISILVIAILLFSAVALGNSTQGKGNDKVRVIAHTDKEVSEALAKGCKVAREARTLKALICSVDVTSLLGLQEDVQVFAMDSGANKQIRADMVQAAGNNGQGRKVVILDTGYNYNHSELNSSYLGGKDFVNNDDDPFDDNGHGSHVAGIITADGVDPKTKGVAPATGIIAGKVLSASGGGYFSDVVAAIYWAVDGPDGIASTTDDFNADAISMSLGTTPPYTYKGFCDGVLPDLTSAIKYAKERGVIVVVAAGNSGDAGVSIPGCISYSTTVGAVNSSDTIASWSGRGSAVDITAPGVNIYSSWLGTSYATLSGTSMATPMVSGTVALIRFTHPEYTPTQIETALFKTAKDLGTAGWDKYYGWGRVDALTAVNYSKPKCAIDADCNDGLYCNGAETCLNGVCQAGTPVNCSSLSNQCNNGVCDEATISCIAKPKSDGTVCDDGLYCNTGETCQVGVCTGGSARVCNDGKTCTTDSCSEEKDVCEYIWPVCGISDSCCGPTCNGTQGDPNYDPNCPTAVKCWSSGYGYLYRNNGQASKFCKCASGIYGYKSYTSRILRSTVYKYVNTGDNEIWGVTPISSNLPVYQVTCTDGMTYSTAKDYWYPK